MIITDEIRKELVGKNLICQSNNFDIKEGKSYEIIKAEEYMYNDLKTLVTIINDKGEEDSYDLMWFVDKQNKRIVYDDKIKFDNLYFSPISYIRLNGMNDNYFRKYLKNNEPIISIKEPRQITYSELPQLMEWLKDVYSLSSDIKNRVEYVGFLEAKEYMLKGNKAEFENETYYIKNGELYCEDINSACALKLRAIESDKWILL